MQMQEVSLNLKSICQKKAHTANLLVEREGYEMTRESTDSRAKWNGGDYDEWVKYVQYWAISKSSCDMDSGLDMQDGGFLYGTPVIVVFPVHSGFPISICFADDTRVEVKREEWIELKNSWKEVCSSDWGVDFNFNYG